MTLFVFHFLTVYYILKYWSDRLEFFLNGSSLQIIEKGWSEHMRERESIFLRVYFPPGHHVRTQGLSFSNRARFLPVGPPRPHPQAPQLQDLLGIKISLISRVLLNSCFP